jgi:trans-2,3-dihydro-3-hydroxyanthranilate isomerase
MSSGKGLSYQVLDVFAEAPLTGNPVAVIFGAGRLATADMQAFARETNLSETTFVLGDTPRDGAWDVRIFTPGSELPYAGHPTLGTASAIRARLLGGGADSVVLRLGVGPVPVRFAADGVAWLESPAARFEPLPAPERLAAVLGLPASAFDSTLPIEVQRTGAPQLFVPLVDAAAVARARVQTSHYDELRATGAPGSLYVFARGARDPHNHWSVRLFAPAYGIIEDPATGSAAGFLGGYLVRHKAHGAGPLDVRLEQGHEIARPSLLRVRQGRSAIEVGGRVIPVANGEWL